MCIIHINVINFVRILGAHACVCIYTSTYRERITRIIMRVRVFTWTHHHFFNGKCIEIFESLFLVLAASCCVADTTVLMWLVTDPTGISYGIKLNAFISLVVGIQPPGSIRVHETHAF